MQFLAVIFLGICAGFAVLRAFDAYRWRETRRLWVCSVIAVPLIAATAIVSWHFFARPILLQRGFSGFGPEWICTNPGYGDLVCIKKAPTTQAPSGDSN